MKSTRQLIVVMGPSGCGKSTIGAALAHKTAWPFLEGDDCHPQANKDKMAKGTALNDDDRSAWLDALIESLTHRAQDTVLLACSALTPYVQMRLTREGGRHVTFVFLDVPDAALAKRIEDRTDHFMPASLLHSQLQALEVPKNAIRINANQSIKSLIDDILTRLKDSTQHQCESKSGNAH